jgi:hypothetical protein
MRTWLLFGLGIGLAVAVMSLMEREPGAAAPLVGRELDLSSDEAAPLLPAISAPAAVPAAEPVAAAVAAEAGLAAAPAPPLEPPLMVVARIADLAVREPAAGLAQALSLEEPALRESAVRAVLQGWSAEYPEAAAAHFNSLPTYAERVATADVFARVFAERDPYAALEWLHTLKPPIADVERAILAGIESIPPERAIEIVRETSTGEDARAVAVARLVAIALEIDPKSVRELANAAFALPPSETSEQLLRFLVGEWAVANPVATLEWLVERSDVLPSTVFMQAAFRIGAHDPNAAGSYSDRVPRALRSEWIGAAAGGYASVSARDAAAWIGRYTGDPAHPNAAVAVAEHLGLWDGPAAAALLVDVDPALPRYVNAVAAVGAGWARQDAPAAGAWAERLATLDARAGAFATVAREWAAEDEERALEGVLGLPRNRASDRGLGPFLSGAAWGTARDRVVLAAFSTSEARRRASEEATEERRRREERDRFERERRARGLR